MTTGHHSTERHKSDALMHFWLRGIHIAFVWAAIEERRACWGQLNVQHSLTGIHYFRAAWFARMLQGPGYTLYRYEFALIIVLQLMGLYTRDVVRRLFGSAPIATSMSHFHACRARCCSTSCLSHAYHITNNGRLWSISNEPYYSSFHLFAMWKSQF